MALTIRTKLTIAAAAALLLGIVVLVLRIREMNHQKQVDACNALRTEIGGFKTKTFDVVMAKMRNMRLNDEQAATLRSVDPGAYARYVTAFAESVDAVAASADQLGALVSRYRDGSCMDLR